VSLVIDASITLAWFFEDGRTDHGDDVMRRVASDGAIVPSLWRLEVANALQSAVRQQRIDGAYRDASLASLRLFPIAIDNETDQYAWETTLTLAERCQLTLYDAAYLELAQRLRLPLASLDRGLRTACRKVRVDLR
jgi:predicted nucleic acid-binding protein